MNAIACCWRVPSWWRATSLVGSAEAERSRSRTALDLGATCADLHMLPTRVYTREHAGYQLRCRLRWLRKDLGCLRLVYWCRLFLDRESTKYPYIEHSFTMPARVGSCVAATGAVKAGARPAVSQYQRERIHTAAERRVLFFWRSLRTHQASGAPQGGCRLGNVATGVLFKW